MKVIENNQLDIRNLTNIGADNANVNFGEHHSVFKLLKDLCPHLLKGISKCSLSANFDIFRLVFAQLFYVCRKLLCTCST